MVLGHPLAGQSRVWIFFRYKATGAGRVSQYHDHRTVFYGLEYTVLYSQIILLFKPHSEKNTDAAVAKIAEKDQGFGLVQAKRIVFCYFRQKGVNLLQILFICHTDIKIKPSYGEPGYIGQVGGDHFLIGNA